MLKQNKNNIFPSHEQFMAYVNGSMATEEMKSFEVAIDSDAFLSDALEGYQSNPDWVASISNKINGNLQAKYSAPKSGSIKYFIIAAAALMVVILSVVLYNTKSINDEQVNKKTLVSTETEAEGVNFESENNASPKESIAPVTESENKSSSVDELPQEVNEEIVLAEDEVNENSNEDNFEDDLIENLVSNKKDNGDAKKESNSLSKTARLAVVNVQIGLKENPSESKPTKTKIVNGQIVRVNKTKNRTYNQEDLPSYYGGDDALLAEIRGSIKPVVVQINSKYNRVIGFEFVVNANGRADVKSLKFIVEPYPEIKKQIINAIRNLPSFKPGKAVGKKGKIKYSILMKF